MPWEFQLKAKQGLKWFRKPNTRKKTWSHCGGYWYAAKRTARCCVLSDHTWPDRMMAPTLSYRISNIGEYRDKSLRMIDGSWGYYDYPYQPESQDRGFGCQRKGLTGFFLCLDSQVLRNNCFHQQRLQLYISHSFCNQRYCPRHFNSEINDSMHKHYTLCMLNLYTIQETSVVSCTSGFVQYHIW